MRLLETSQYRTNVRERRKPALGQFGELTVEQARFMAQEWLAEVCKGGDPSAATKALLTAALSPSWGSGQLDKHEWELEDGSPLGIILCTGKEREQIELLELDNPTPVLAG